MADLEHLSNLIQGEVLRVRERRPLEEQTQMLDDLIEFMQGQVRSITLTKLRVNQEIEALADSTE